MFLLSVARCPLSPITHVCLSLQANVTQTDDLGQLVHLAASCSLLAGDRLAYKAYVIPFLQKETERKKSTSVFFAVVAASMLAEVSCRLISSLLPGRWHLVASYVYEAHGDVRTCLMLCCCFHSLG